MAETAQKTITGQLQWQADACRMIGSPLYAGLLERATEDVQALGPTWEILRGHENDPRFSVLGLRLLGAVNRMVLSGREPALADAYRHGRLPEAWEELRGTLYRNASELRSSLERPVQTNEVGRCAALLFGFLTVAAETQLPLRLLEVGASAGLNLRWDHYGYRANGFSWGPDGSPVELDFELDGKPLTSFPTAVEIASRNGCDAAPIDPSSAEGRLTLLTYIWPDQHERIARMRTALEVAEDVPAPLDREAAAPWARRMLAERAPGQATVIYHSIVSQYLSDGEREALFGCIRDAGERAGADAPLAWLRMEPNDDRADVHLTLWPGGEDRRLARAGYHGTPVELL
ncbi:MAG TPA: DUF2332 domain-containing protein [Solirubrobacterales bacterium]|jgi:hypothetical protein|nr:DUF2332 domain-containing protein [Solirubrobacterales bacterium]